MAKARGLNTWLNRATKRLLVQTSSGDMERHFAPLVFHDESGEPASNDEWIHAPDLSAVAGFPAKYWIVTGDGVTLMDAAQRDAVDASTREASRDDAVKEFDQQEALLRAVALVMLDQLNTLRALHGLPDATPAQLKSAIRAKLGS